MAKSVPAKNDLFVDILLTILTLGLWNIWVQIRQVRVINKLSHEKHFLPMIVIFLLCIFTFGLYFIYHEVKTTRILHQLRDGEGQFWVEFGMGWLTLLGIWIVVDSYQQSMINEIIDSRSSGLWDDNLDPRGFI